MFPAPQQTLLGRVAQHNRFQEINSDLVVPRECAKSNEKAGKSNHSPTSGAELGAFVCAHNPFLMLNLALLLYIFY